MTGYATRKSYAHFAALSTFSQIFDIIESFIYMGVLPILG
jgi:hypothetical protein